MKLKSQLDILKYSRGVLKKFPLGGVLGGTGPPNVNLGPPEISVTTRARILKFKIQLDIVKYSLWVKIFLR